jgi:hypothetical protein
MTENVIERLGTTESTTLSLKREDGGKIRARKLRYHDEWDPAVEPYFTDRCGTNIGFLD